MNASARSDTVHIRVSVNGDFPRIEMKMPAQPISRPPKCDRLAVDQGSAAERWHISVLEPGCLQSISQPNVCHESAVNWLSLLRPGSTNDLSVQWVLP